MRGRSGQRESDIRKKPFNISLRVWGLCRDRKESCGFAGPLRIRASTKVQNYGCRGSCFKQPNLKI